MDSIGAVIKSKKVNSHTVDSKYKYIKTVNSNITVSKRIDAFLEDQHIEPEGVAQKLAEDLDDGKSIGYYLILVQENSSGMLLKALHLTKDASNRGKIKRNKAVYFLAILRNWGLKTKFKR